MTARQVAQSRSVHRSQIVAVRLAVTDSRSRLTGYIVSSEVWTCLSTRVSGPPFFGPFLVLVLSILRVGME
jgi:hypothetical protein